MRNELRVNAAESLGQPDVYSLFILALIVALVQHETTRKYIPT